MRRRPVWVRILVLGLLATGCSRADVAPSSTSHATTSPLAEVTVMGPAVPTHQGPDGNRFVIGQGRPLAFETMMVADEQVSWVAGFDGPAATVIVAVDDAGGVAVSAAGEVSRHPHALPPGMPPLVVPSLDPPVAPPFTDAARASAPAIDADDTLLYVSEVGELVVVPAAGEVRRVDVDSLLDGRIVIDDRGRALVLTEPTDRYGHAVLGDALEPSGFAVVDVAGGSIVARHTLDPPAVFEAVVPMWADVDDDGEQEIALTVSEPDGGARIVVYDAAGELMAEGPPIGRGFRWRHLIAVGPFGPGGETEIAVVRTPHIGGVLEMYRLHDGELVIAESMTGPFGSHALGSRNLDMAVAGDFDGDGQPEIVLPSADRRTIAGIAHRSGGLEEVWAVDLPAALTSNLAVVPTAAGPTLAAGLADGSVVRWSP